MLRLAQVGLRGFGRIHLERIDRLVGMGRIELVAGADPAGPESGRAIVCYDSLDELLARHQVDIVSIATPIGTHMALASQALAAGAHVMLEKPPVASLDEFWDLAELSHRSGLSVQVGFQSLGGGGIARMRQLAGISTGVVAAPKPSRAGRSRPGDEPLAAVLGEITSIQVWGMWQRDLAYFKRARWAGHRVLDGRRVADGVCTNALAHSIATACRIVSLTSIAEIASIETELYHCFDTASDDTSWLRVNRAGGPFASVPIDVSLTLCGPRAESPTVTLVGTDGWAELSYTTDVVRWQTRAESSDASDGSLYADPHHSANGSPAGLVHTEQHPRTDLLENLVDHIETNEPLLVPLPETIGFMAVLEATQSVPDPRPIPGEFLTWHGQGDQAHPVPEDIEAWQHRCLAEGQGYAAAGAPWATDQAHHVWVPR